MIDFTNDVIIDCNTQAAPDLGQYQTLILINIIGSSSRVYMETQILTRTVRLVTNDCPHELSK